MRIKPLAVVWATLALACIGCQEESGKRPENAGKLSPAPHVDLETRRYVEKAGGFSYDPPGDWEIVDYPGMKYKVCRGPAAHGFAPNIVIVDENYPGDLGDYADRSVENLKNLFEGVVVLHRDNLTAADGVPVIRVALEDDQVRRRLRQTFYFFANGSRKYVATCTCLAEDGNKLEPTFDEAMKTFRTH